MRRAVLAFLLAAGLAATVAGQASKPSRLDGLAKVLAESDDVEVQRDVLRGMHEALAGRRDLRAPAGWSAVYRKLSASKDAEVRDKVLVLSVLFGDPGALARLREIAADGKAGAEQRRSALTTLVEKRVPDLLPLLEKLLDDAPMRGPALRALASQDAPAIPGWILARYPKLSAAEKVDAVSTLSTRPAFALALLDAVERKQVARQDVSAFAARQIVALKDARATRRLAEVWGSIRPPDGDRKVQMAKYLKLVRPDDLKKADRKAGRVVYQRLCASCHVLFDAGTPVGPELTGAQRGNPEYVLSELIDPGAVVAREYLLQIVETKAGRILSGIVKEENERVLTLQTLNEVVRVPRADIVDRLVSKQSMMPEGMLDKLSEREVRDLIAYVGGPGQVPLAKEKK